MPIGVQAEGSERTWMGRNRSKTGRKTLRFTASAYREILHETLLRGKASAVPALKTALCEVETRLGWTRERRAQIVLRMDGGCGTTEVLHWVLSRGYQVVAKISHSGRVRGLSMNGTENWERLRYSSNASGSRSGRSSPRATSSVKANE